MADIAIIGAGMAGLSALQVLASAGHQVTLFDKSRGSGGRMATKKVGEASWDMGAQFIRSHDAAFSSQLQHWEQLGWVARWEVQPFELLAGKVRPSPDNATRYVGTPRMTGLCRRLLEPASGFIDSTRIISTHYKEQQWWLVSDDNREFGPFQALIINTPPQQAAPLLTASPALQKHCDEVAMLPCWTLLFTLPERADLPDLMFVKDGPIGYMARNNSKPGRDDTEAWVVQANHQWSRQHIDSPREDVQNLLLGAIAEATGLDTGNAGDLWLHRWLYAIPDEPLRLGALTDLSQNLAVCGDWCHSPNLEGAWLSGRQAANSLLSILN